MALRQFNNIPIAGNIYQMYTTFLAIIETKVIIVNRGVTNLQLNSSDFMNFEPNENLVITVKSMLCVPDHITSAVNAIGIVKTSDKMYKPRIGKFIPQSEQVTYSTLRETVEALADVNTPAEYRRRFYRTNPIPGTVWREAPDNPILMNADEIIPANYQLDDLIGDIEDVKIKLLFLNRKGPKYFNQTIKYEVEGSKSMLTCNDMESMRVVDRREGEDINDYQARVRLEQDIQSYWNIEKLNANEMVTGALSLLGECSNSDILK